MNVYLVRHGETAHNRDGVGFGRADVPLTPLGHAQATAVAAKVAAIASLDAIVSSPLQRALLTAEAIRQAAGVATVVLDERLLELSVGQTEGLPMRDVRARFPGLLEEWAGPRGHEVRLPGGESIKDLHQRVREFRASLDTSSSTHLAVVAHNFVLRVLLCELLGLGPERFRSVNVDLASLSVVSVGLGIRTSVLLLNDTCHLEGLAS